MSAGASPSRRNETNLRVIMSGGSVGLGHPVGMSGLRIVVHLANALKQRDLKRGGATVPAGSGLGAAVLLERAAWT